MEPTLFATELEKFRAHQTRITATLHHQQATLSEISADFKLVTESKKARATQGRWGEAERNKRDLVARLGRATQTYGEVRAGVQKGLQFYQDLVDLVEGLKEQVVAFLRSRDSERNQLASAADIKQRLEGPRVASPPSSGLERQMGSMDLGGGARSPPTLPPQPPSWPQQPAYPQPPSQPSYSQPPPRQPSYPAPPAAGSPYGLPSPVSSPYSGLPSTGAFSSAPPSSSVPPPSHSPYHSPAPPLPPSNTSYRQSPLPPPSQPLSYGALPPPSTPVAYGSYGGPPPPPQQPQQYQYGAPQPPPGPYGSQQQQGYGGYGSAPPPPRGY